MRAPQVTGPQALQERLAAKYQVPAEVPEAAMTPYMESFLAHLRLLVGVPFDYLIPDERLLPDESIRFFYLDRSWTDRLVDGAIAVGKTGTREQAHHQAHAGDLASTLDSSERIVRALQQGTGFDTAKQGEPAAPAGVITGFLLRSAAVSGWPQMDVRAFSQPLPWPVTLEEANKSAIKTLRLELLSKSVLLALFDGIPQTVWCEQPHHDIQFAIHTDFLGRLFVYRRGPTGQDENSPTVTVPVRQSNRQVLSIAGLRRNLCQTHDPNLAPQNGSAGLAIEILDLPWRQRFEGAGSEGTWGGFVGSVTLAPRLDDPSLTASFEGLVK